MLISSWQLRAALTAVSIMGIATLFLADSFFAAEKTTALQAKEVPDGKKVLVEGRALNAFVAKNTLFFTLKDHTGNTVKIVKFMPSKEDLDTANYQGFVSVTGRTQRFQNEQEILAEEVKKIG